ncbi:hypothetical protein EVAR_33122_1 [Eumeta japonica]|uniref:Uncharacterized protein n=1 Tax=Eumeta variegata TaxID=151549 RepID=A0A4C1YAQ7_EUMVA|nr:hypothetical protein EVAR_33122_1 [Eumeta japonica]
MQKTEVEMDGTYVAGRKRKVDQANNGVVSKGCTKHIANNIRMITRKQQEVTIQCGRRGRGIGSQSRVRRARRIACHAS